MRQGRGRYWFCSNLLLRNHQDLSRMRLLYCSLSFTLSTQNSYRSNMSTMCALCAASYHFSEFRGNTGVHFYTFLPVSTPTECSKHSNAVPNAQQILRNEQLQNGYPSLISSQSHIGLSTQMSTPALQEPVLCPPETQRSGLRASKIDT